MGERENILARNPLSPPLDLPFPLLFIKSPKRGPEEADPTNAFSLLDKQKRAVHASF